MGLSEEAQAPDASVGAFLRRKFDEVRSPSGGGGLWCGPCSAITWH